MSRQYCPWPDPTLTLPTLAARQQPTGAILLSLTAKWVLSVSTSSYLRLLPFSLFQLNQLSGTCKASTSFSPMQTPMLGLGTLSSTHAKIA